MMSNTGLGAFETRWDRHKTGCTILLQYGLLRSSGELIDQIRNEFANILIKGVVHYHWLRATLCNTGPSSYGSSCTKLTRTTLRRKVENAESGERPHGVPLREHPQPSEEDCSGSGQLEQQPDILHQVWRFQGHGGRMVWGDASQQAAMESWWDGGGAWGSGRGVQSRQRLYGHPDKILACWRRATGFVVWHRLTMQSRTPFCGLPTNPKSCHFMGLQWGPANASPKATVKSVMPPCFEHWRLDLLWCTKLTLIFMTRASKSYWTSETMSCVAMDDPQWCPKSQKSSCTPWLNNSVSVDDL